MCILVLDMKKSLLILTLLLITNSVWSSFIYVPMSADTQKNHLKAYGIVYFGLEVGDRALHCLPVDYVAGKMMLVRAMILGLDMHMMEPRLELNSFDGNYDFCAMIPLQAKNTLPEIGQILKLGADNKTSKTWWRNFSQAQQDD